MVRNFFLPLSFLVCMFFCAPFAYSAHTIHRAPGEYQKGKSPKLSPAKSQPGKKSRKKETSAIVPENSPKKSFLDSPTPITEGEVMENSVSKTPPAPSSDQDIPAIGDPTAPLSSSVSKGKWERVRNIFSLNQTALRSRVPKKVTKTVRRPIPDLQGILTASDRDDVAILNDQVVRKGGVIDGFKVEKISRKSVVLSIDGEELVVNVKEE